MESSENKKGFEGLKKIWSLNWRLKQRQRTVRENWIALLEENLKKLIHNSK